MRTKTRPARFLRSLTCLASFLLAAGCSSAPPGKAHPIIDDIDFPSAATAGADGSYSLAGSIAYHDDDEAVTGVHLRVVATGQLLSLAVPAAAKVAKLPITIQLAGAKGALDYEVSVVSASGLESASLRETVMLE